MTRTTASTQAESFVISHHPFVSKRKPFGTKLGVQETNFRERNTMATFASFVLVIVICHLSSHSIGCIQNKYHSRHAPGCIQGLSSIISQRSYSSYKVWELEFTFALSHGYAPCYVAPWARYLCVAKVGRYGCRRPGTAITAPCRR